MLSLKPMKTWILEEAVSDVLSLDCAEDISHFVLSCVVSGFML